MIKSEADHRPTSFEFDVAIVAVGYERRCRYVSEFHSITANVSLGLEFGFLTEKSYPENRRFFTDRSFKVISGIDKNTSTRITDAVRSIGERPDGVTVFVDISSMSREMIANVVLGLREASLEVSLSVSAAYAPSKFGGPYDAAPIRRAGPITPILAGWSSQPEVPVGVVFGLGCEPGLALGALQLLEPRKAWAFEPKGTDSQYDQAMRNANVDLGQIFDVTSFRYEIIKPSSVRGRLEVLINSIASDFRVIVVPFGPKIFAWCAILTIALSRRRTTGVWAFSSKEQAIPVDRDAEGYIVWHNTLIRS
jgi:hypothetical protein